MATTTFFNGRLIAAPGSYSEVDASGLETVGLGASGIVALLGTAEGGKPANEMEKAEDFTRLKKPEAARSEYRSGDLREASGICFEPAKDEAILGGAVEIVAMKVNPATQSTVTLPNVSGDALTLTSVDYGEFTKQANISIADGTTVGKLLAILFEDKVEGDDNIGGDAIFNLSYSASGGGWDTSILAQVVAGGSITTTGTSAHTGLDGDIGTQLVAPGAVEVVSDSAQDDGVVEIYGLDAAGDPISEFLTLGGVTPVVGTTSFTTVLGAYLTSGVTVGNVLVRASGAGATVLTIATGTSAEGAIRKAVMFANGLVTLVAGAASSKDVILVGKALSGATILEKVTLNGTTPVPSVGTFAKVLGVILGDVAAASTVTFSAEVAKALVTTQTTIQKAADYFNARNDGSGGFDFTIVTGLTSFALSDLDVMTASVSIMFAANPDFYADLWAIAKWINDNSAILSAEVAAGAVGGAPSNTSAPVFLEDGIEGVTTFTNWQDALNKLKWVRVNSVVALSTDPAVTAAVEAHNAYMCGIGRSERDGFAGIQNAAQDGLASKTEIKSQIVDINSRHMRLIAQDIERYNTSGERETFNPKMAAAMAAGMQAGSAVGESLTYKYANVLSINQDSSWNPTDDAEEMIQAGLWLMESIDGVGRRVVRNITTHLSSNNLAFVEGSVNEAVNFAVFNFRTNMEMAVGRKGFSGTIIAAKGVALGTLDLMVDEEILTQHRALFIENVVDVLEVSVEIAPVIPINFVKNTMHLVTIQQSA